MSKIMDFLMDKELSKKINKLKTPYKILYMVCIASFMLLGFALLDWQIGAIEAGIIGGLAYFPARFIMTQVIKNKGESIFYPNK